MSAETDLIKERINIAEVVGEYVRLKQVGRHFKGLCPFHQEKTPSFLVSPDKGIWHCFGCNSGGDVFSFMERIESLDFPAALRLLAERAGVTLAQAQAPHQRDQRTRLFAVLQQAAQFYAEVLLRQPLGKEAREYLAQRGVEVETMERFGLGYAPQSWTALQRYLAHHHISEDDALAAGLIGRSDKGKLYDRFRGRIMFPIHDVQGRVVGFGGRIAPWHATGEEGKYVNSPETAVYEKRRTVYNLHRAKAALRRHEPCLVVEGYMDVVMLAQAGIANVVASSGTAFTAEQIKLLQRFTNTLHFAFDSDTAGIHAAQAATQEAIAAGCRVATILFPPGQDPADVAKAGAAAIRSHLEKPISLAAFLLRHFAATPAGRAEALTSLLPLVREVGDPVQQGEMIQEIAQLLHVPEASIFRRLEQLQPRLNVPLREQGASAAPALDYYCVGLMLISPAVRQALWTQISPEHFLDPRMKALYIQLQQCLEAEVVGTALVDDVLSRLPPDVLPLAEGVRRMTEEYLVTTVASPQAEGVQLGRQLLQRYVRQRLQVLHEELPHQAELDRDRTRNEIQALIQELASLAK